MGIIDFLGLNENDQWRILWDEGQKLEKKILNGTTYELYGLHDFFVEVTIKNKLDIPSGLMPFKDGPRLEKYTD